MHRVLYFIVPAESEQEAISNATEGFETLRERTDTTYDYCKPMESGHNVAGSDRWTGFKGEPVAAPLSKDKAVEWVEEGMGYTERHFAENLYGLFQHMLDCLEDGVETAPKAIDEILEYVKENREDTSWSDGGETIREEWPRTIEALYEDTNGTMHRYYASQLSECNPMVAHIMDCVSYQGVTVADNSFRLENVREMLEERPSDVWVVPMDTHF